MTRVSKTLSIAVFGANGFIGSHLVKRLCASGHKVISFDRKYPEFNDLANRYYCDITDEIEVKPEVKIDVAINLAATHRTPGHESFEYYNTNVLGSLNILKWCDQHAITNVVFVSSIAVYGPGDELKTELSKLEPISDYGRSKAIAEKVHEAWVKVDNSRKLIIIRPAVIFGSGEKGNFVRLANAIRRRVFFYTSSSSNKKAAGYVKDLVRCIEFFADGKGQTGIYNFAFKKNYSIEEICDSICKVANFPKVGSVPFNVSDNIVLNRILGKTFLWQRIQKLNSQTIVSVDKLESSGFVWIYDFQGAIDDWYRESKFDSVTSKGFD